MCRNPGAPSTVWQKFMHLREKLDKIENLLRTCNTEIIPLVSGGWEIYADFGENSGCHIKTDSKTTLWNALEEIGNPYHHDRGEK